MNAVIPIERPSEKVGFRYAVCSRCRHVYNISEQKIIPYKGYVCEKCEGRKHENYKA